jgi:hypothetical protein
MGWRQRRSLAMQLGWSLAESECFGESHAEAWELLAKPGSGVQVSPNVWLLGRRGRSLPANASGVDTHRASITSRFDWQARATQSYEKLNPGASSADWDEVLTRVCMAAFGCSRHVHSSDVADPAQKLSRPIKEELRQVSQNGQLLGRRGRSLPANASGVDTHRASITSRSDCRAPTGAPGCATRWTRASGSWRTRSWRSCGAQGRATRARPSGTPPTRRCARRRCRGCGSGCGR